MAAPALSAKLDLMAVLEDRGHRSTVPRREVISAIESKVDSFTAEEISDALPAVGRATVFRTIKLLLEAGVLCKRALPDGAPTYVVARIEHHHHTRCGQVVEFRDATIERLMRLWVSASKARSSATVSSSTSPVEAASAKTAAETRSRYTEPPIE